MVRTCGLLKWVVFAVVFSVAIFVASQLLDGDVSLDSLMTKPVAPESVSIKAPRYKCGLSKSCPTGHFAFKITSGAASVVGPKMCVEDRLLMSSVKNNVGRGINIALINGRTGALVKTEFFDMWAGDVAPLIKFLKEIEEGTIVMMAAFDDPATKLNEEARQLISDLGSSMISAMGFRDSWVFVGGKGIKTKTPFEQHIKNSADTNKFEGWPDVLEMEGCVPQRVD